MRLLNRVKKYLIINPVEWVNIFIVGNVRLDHIPITFGTSPSLVEDSG